MSSDMKDTELNKYDVPKWLIEALKSYDGFMSSPKADFKGSKMKAKRELAALIKRETDKAVQQAQNTGHWFAREKQLDASWNFGYWCNCGFKSSRRETIDGHVAWQLAQLKQQQGEGK